MTNVSIPIPCDPIRLGEFLLSKAKFPAVYFLFKRGELVYVGQSKTLYLRIEEHLTQGVKLFDAVAYLRCSVDQLTRIEGHYIRTCVPKYNDCAIARKARDKAGWAKDRARRRVSGNRKEEPLESLERVDAAECIIPDNEVAEFLNVCESDAADWIKNGFIPDTSVLGLIYYAVNNNRQVSAAQAKYEAL
jgi:hypothetical protein